jgi:hypothetical protein
LLPDACLACIPKAAHAINFSYPNEFKAAILGFLLGESGPASTGTPKPMTAYQSTRREFKTSS